MAEKSLDTKVQVGSKAGVKAAVRSALAERVVRAGGVAVVAAKAGISKGYVTHICAGRRSPSLDTLAALAVALDVGMGVVIGEIGAVRKPSPGASSGTHTG
jgi:transcriptional regulator with XRE-family HTH domain